VSTTTTRPIYVSGHRKPDTDSIAAAVGYAELCRETDPATEYVPVRLGELSPQTRWCLERSGAAAPRLLPHVSLRACDVMAAAPGSLSASHSILEASKALTETDATFVVLLDDDGTLFGVLTERTLARQYVSEASASLALPAPTSARDLARTVEGTLVAGSEQSMVSGRVWVLASEGPLLLRTIAPGDIAVVGNREDVQRAALAAGIAAVVVTNGAGASEETRSLARELGTPLVTTDLDSAVVARRAMFAAPCGALADRQPLVVGPNDLIDDISPRLRDVHYRGAVVTDTDHRPVGVVRYRDLLTTQPRRVILVDHSDRSQSIPGVEDAEIIEVLDHHHVGSIETRLPIRATFDPVGATSTLVSERFREGGREPSEPTALLLLLAILADTVLLRSPTTTNRDKYECCLLADLAGVDYDELGRAMFDASTANLTLSAREIVERDAKTYELSLDRTVYIAQVETVGDEFNRRAAEFGEELDRLAREDGHVVAALMITDIIAEQTLVVCGGDLEVAQAAFGDLDAQSSRLLAGVMSRKRQVAPLLLAI